MRSNYVRRFVCVVIMLLAVALAFPTVNAEAKSGRRLSAKTKTLSVGQDYTLKLKKLSKKDRKSAKKVKWAVSDKKVLAVKKKTKYGITVHARSIGEAKVTGKYKGKKYSCMVKVTGEVEETDEEKDEDIKPQSGKAQLNASEIDLYYMADEDKKYITPESGHNYSYKFKVSGVPKDEIIRWSIETDKRVNCYHVTDDGEVYLFIDPSNYDESNDATLIAKLENGKKLTARLHGYSERGIAVKKIIDDFVAKYITSDMTEYEKMETIAKYVEHEYDYVLYQSDWRYMVLSGGGDCYSSKYFVKFLSEAVGMKALACLGDDYHGQTLIKADGEMYITVTGFNEPKPRRYMIMKLSDKALQNVAKCSRIDLTYFD